MSKRKVPSNEELARLYLEEKKTSTEIAEMCGATKISVCRALRNAGVEMRKMTGENHGSWKGGRVSKGSGYIGIWKPEHPSASANGYVYEHTLVMEEKLGRPLHDWETVHHVDGNKLNNLPENLYPCSQSDHLSLHRQIEKFILPMMEAGIIGFNHEKGEYFLK